KLRIRFGQGLSNFRDFARSEASREHFRDAGLNSEPIFARHGSDGGEHFVGGHIGKLPAIPVVLKPLPGESPRPFGEQDKTRTRFIAMASETDTPQLRPRATLETSGRARVWIVDRPRYCVRPFHPCPQSNSPALPKLTAG